MRPTPRDGGVKTQDTGFGGLRELLKSFTETALFPSGWEKSNAALDLADGDGAQKELALMFLKPSEH